MKNKDCKVISLIIGLFLFSAIISGCSQKSTSAKVSYSTAKRSQSSIGVKNAANINSNSNGTMSMGGSGNSSDKSLNKGAADAPKETSITSATSEASNKIILSGSIQMETLKYEDTVKAITDYVTSIGGYSENSTIQGSGINYSDTPQLRQATFVFRIPKDKFPGFFTGLKGFGTITSQQMSGKDVTETYTDTDAKVNSLKIQEQRLLELTKQAGQLSDILQIEKELTSVRQQIDSLTSQLKTIDNQVTYSTVNVVLQEVDKPTSVAPNKSKGLFERMGYSFTESMKNLWIVTQSLLVFIVTVLPFVVAIGVLIVIGFYIRKGIKKLKEKYKTK